MEWDASKYDGLFSFVSTYGESLLPFLNPNKGERILDLECGTGDLTNMIYQTGAVISGIDSSLEMTRAAKKKYPHIDFRIIDARDIKIEEKFDAVFSNAVLHWIPEKGMVISQVYAHLKRGGRFVAEFGGKGNLQLIRTALTEVFAQRDVSIDARFKFRYNPTIGEYTTELEKTGFSVKLAEHYERPTALIGKNGIKDWIKLFGADLFINIEESERENILDDVEVLLAKDILKDDVWYADYKRLRIVAIKM